MCALKQQFLSVYTMMSISTLFDRLYNFENK